MSKNSYKNFEDASEGLSGASLAAGATTAIPNPMKGVLDAQRAYHMHQFRKDQVDGMRKAVSNEQKAIERDREMQTPQVKASDLTYGKNGITEENGFLRDSEGKIFYEQKK